MIQKTLKDRGLKPKVHILENECSNALKRFMEEEEGFFQLFTPGIQRINSVERHIKTWKSHFISGLSSCPKGLPLNFWDYLISQGCLTLNLLLKSHINPKLSAQAQLHGMFDFNATPLAPPGKKIIT